TAILQRMGHSYHRQHRGALQPDVLSQWIDLAAPQCSDSPWPRALRPQAPARSPIQRLVRCRELSGDAALAGTVLRLSTQPRSRADALSGRMLATGLGERHAVYVDRSFARTAIRSRRQRNPSARSTPALVFGRARSAQFVAQPVERRLE